MAGYTLGFDDGGAVPDDQDVTGSTPETAAPASADATATPAPGAAADYDPSNNSDAQGASEATPGTPEQNNMLTPQRADALSPQGGLGDIAGGAKKIVSYLMGQGAADPQTAKTFEQGVKHENPGISDSDANLLVIHQAHEMGGPGAAWAMLQYNRAGYNSSSALATAALNGVEGKPADAKRAADEATKAAAFVPDGANIQFTPAPDGNFTAAVKLPGTSQVTKYMLTPQALAQVVSVGGDGQYDKVLQDGQPKIIQTIAQQASSSTGAPATGGPTDKSDKSKDRPEDNDDLHATGGPNPNADQPTNFGKTPSTVNLSGSDKQQPNLNGNMDEPYSQRVRAQAYAEHPWASEDTARRAEMVRLSQSDEDRDAKVKAEQTKTESAQKIAQTRADAAVSNNQRTNDTRSDIASGHDDTTLANTGLKNQGAGDRNQARIDAQAKITQQKLDAAVNARLRQTQDGKEKAQLIEKGKLARTEMSQPGADPDKILAKYGLTPGVNAPATPTAAAPTKVAAPQDNGSFKPPEGAKQAPNGKWYVPDPSRPGKSMWAPGQS